VERLYQAFATGFHDMIMQETDPLVNELKVDQATGIHAEAMNILSEFLTDQRAILLNISEHADANPERLQDMLGQNGNQDRNKVVEDSLNTLNRYVA